MKVVITGSTGRIGRAIYVAMARVHSVLGIDRAPSSTADIVDDFTHPEILRRALKGADAVVHVAALHAPHVGLVADAEFQRINVDGTQALIDACAREGIPRLVFTSTTALYGHASTPQGTAGWVTESLSPEPRTIYHRTKLEAERRLEEASIQGGPKVRILRMSRCFPEPVNVMAAFRLHRGVDARDVASGHVKALDHLSGMASCETFILSGSTPFERSDCDQLADDAAGTIRRREPEMCELFERRGWALPGCIDRVYVSRKAQTELGWSPRWTFREPVRQFDEISSEVLIPRDAAPEKH
jgi:UDP-glucose 4-epimerase